MEIRIKTAEEFWRDKVSIEISGTAAEVQTVGQQLTGGRSDRALYNAALDAERELVQARVAEAQVEKLDAQVREYDLDRRTERDRADRNGAKIEELVAALNRYRKAHVCTDRCRPNAHVAFEGNELVKELETKLATAQQAREIETRRADKAEREMSLRFPPAEMEAAKEGAREDARAAMQRQIVNPLEVKLAQAEETVKALSDLIGKLNGAALGSDIRRALEYLEAAPGTRIHTLTTAMRQVRELLGVTSV